MGFGWNAQSVFSKITGLFGGLRMSVPVDETGYTNMRSYLALLAACYDGINNQDFRPKDGETFCNRFVASVAQRMGCPELNGRLANDIVDYISASPNWTATTVEKAQFLASVGTLVIAGEKATPHGHVCVVVPGVQARSEHWGTLVPVVANVGKDVFMGKGLSFAFQQAPKLYCWKPSI